MIQRTEINFATGRQRYTLDRVVHFYLATCNQRFGTATSCIMCNELGMLYMGGSHLRPVLRAC